MDPRSPHPGDHGQGRLTENVLSALPTSAQPTAKRMLAEIRDAEDRDHAVAAADRFAGELGAKWPKAVAKIVDDLDELLAFYDFPAEHWIHLRTTWFNAPGDDKVMIATRRADVADLNDRARALLDSAGRFGNHELGIDRRIRVAGREFAVGDQVLAVGRNHWDLDILNGDLGTVTAINERHKTVTFHCERVDAERTMPTDRLEAGFLDHGYARTNYKTQGATADRVFALGGDGDLDRQAAYTALSRGRVENRLYMCTPDEDVWEILAPNPQRAQRVEGWELLFEHAERELSRDRSQHLASELLANLPEPDGTPVGVGRDALLAELPEPDGLRTHRSMADDLLASLPQPDVVDEDLAEQVAKATARLDRLQHSGPPAMDGGIGIDLQ